MDDPDYVLDDPSDGDFYHSDEDHALLVPVGENGRPEKEDSAIVEFITKQKNILCWEN